MALTPSKKVHHFEYRGIIPKNSLRSFAGCGRTAVLSSSGLGMIHRLVAGIATFDSALMNSAATAITILHSKQNKVHVGQGSSKPGSIP